MKFARNILLIFTHTNIKKTRLSINTIYFDSANLGIDLVIDLNFLFWLIFSMASRFQPAPGLPLVKLFVAPGEELAV